MTGSLKAENLNQAGIRHGFFTRVGGVSGGIYESLNCGPGSGDDPANVRENRRRVVSSLAGGAAPLWTCYQIHSNKVITVGDAAPPKEPPRADGLVTRLKGVVLGVLTADCAPVLLGDPEAGVVAAAHAGWRGALSGIIPSTVEAMETLGATKENIAAAIGPCIGRESYEVGPEFRETFLAADKTFDAFFAAGKKGRFLFDLPAFVGSRLKDSGITRTEIISVDTYRASQMFFSYRRTCHLKEPDYGRQISAITLL